MEIAYKIITPRNLAKYQNPLLELLKSEWNSTESLLKSLKNSSYIVIALDGEKAVGCFQIITDRLFVAFLINLWVDPEYRKFWIWWKVTELAVSKAEELKVKNIQLVPDPSHPWLKPFYAKYWFKEWIYMWTK
ncbi:MAG: hypothetical protein ACD_2C00193G0013 [uncultured bacterium (gcode 4)]|uniref:N-acetyltransferase domain-containing protein n=1 Tax=uncultured bacterium (gcode 4) TaxID=1234023 RepID=K2G4N4_9BACT|nr:MAG: hypothetical protein ACD_2C00193G0013 [uncultured bacterium (gcode 4)]